jgi:hypothetical protein
MSVSVPPAAVPAPVGAATRPLRVAFLGPAGWLESCCPPGRSATQTSCRLPVVAGCDVDRTLHQARSFRAQVSVVFDPGCLPADALAQLPGTTLGIIVGGVDDDRQLAAAAGVLDRVVSFRPALTGAAVGSARVWRAIPPPVNDALYGEVRPLRGRPQVMAIGRSTEHREDVLMPVKHHHDLLQVIHGVVGETLLQLLREYDVGVYVAPEAAGGFGVQVGMHLAAGQLLFTQGLDPAHGLERDIDYMHFDTADELVWALDRLARFPEMCQRLRVRGRMKAERYRASRLFGRIIEDLLGDVAVFGSPRVSHAGAGSPAP